MNKKLLYIILLLLVGAVMPACEDEDKQLFDDFQRTAIPLFSRKTDDSGIINLLDPNATRLSFTLTKDGLAEVGSIDILITFNNSKTGDSETVVYSNVATLPSDVVITQAELIDAFEENVLTEDTLSIGDSFTINGGVRLTNGLYLTGGYSPSIFSEHPVTIVYNVSCASNIPLGEYTAVSDGTSTDGCPPTNPLQDHPYDVTISSSGPGVYEVSDFFAGVYINWYGACYGYTFETPGDFTDICNDLSFSFSDAFGSTVTGTGVYNPGDGTITYTWTNSFGDTGTTVLTPK